MISWLLAAALALSTPPTAPPAASESATAVAIADPVPKDQVMALPDALRLQVHSVVGEGDSAPTLRFQRLMNFVIDNHGLGMTYQDDATYTVTEAYTKRRANCLTFTLLVLALAKEVGLEAYPRKWAKRCHGAKSTAPSTASPITRRPATTWCSAPPLTASSWA